MTSSSITSSLASEEQVQCSICLDVFTDPVTTQCGHNFCKACLRRHWDSSEVCQCPTCRKRFHVRPEISTNRVLEEIAVQVKRRRLDVSRERPAEPGEVFCDVCAERKLKALKSCLVCLTSYCESHLEPHERVESLKRHKLIEPVVNPEDRMCRKHERLLELFCRSDQMCVCVLCTETDHRMHNTVSIEEEGPQQKGELWTTQLKVNEMIQARLQKINYLKHSVDLSRRITEKEKQDSKKLFAALKLAIEERQAKLLNVMEEKQKEAEEQTEGLIHEMKVEIAELKSRNTKLMQLSRTEDNLHFLQHYPTLCSPPKFRNWSKISVQTLLCVGTVRKAVSLLKKTIEKKIKELTEVELKRMRQFKEDVTLDPGTANRCLGLFQFGKQLKLVDSEAVSDNPGRFNTNPMVLGQRGFQSGRHYWEVQVGLRNSWQVGVAKETVKRKGNVEVNTKHGFFALSKGLFMGYEALTTPATHLHLYPKPKKVGVYVDYEKGEVAFFNVEAQRHLYSFTRLSFKEKLFPYFYLYGKSKKPEALVIS